VMVGSDNLPDKHAGDWPGHKNEKTHPTIIIVFRSAFDVFPIEECVLF
jgi:hypothetical protein